MRHNAESCIGNCVGIRELLRVAGDESQQEPWARVHAINTLRLTFSDKTLANDVSGYFAEGRAIHTHMLCELPCKHVCIRPPPTTVYVSEVCRLLLFSWMLSRMSKPARTHTDLEGQSSYMSLCCMMRLMDACCFSLVTDADFDCCCCIIQQSWQIRLDKGSTML